MKKTEVCFIEQNTRKVMCMIVWVTQLIMAQAHHHAAGKVVSVLEGGYHAVALAHSAAQHIRTLRGL